MEHEHADPLGARFHRVLITGAGGQLGAALARGVPGADARTRAASSTSAEPLALGYVPTSSSTPPRGPTSTEPRTTEAARARQRRRHAERRRARRAGRLLLDRLRVRRDEARRRTSSRTSRRRSSVYGRTKLEGEREIGDGWIVRIVVALRLDGPQLRAHDARGSAPSATRSRVVDDQRGCPTYVGHLAEATRALVELPYGIYHVAADGECTWADFAEAIFEEAGLDCRVVPISTAELGRPAPRPAYSVLRSEKPETPRLPHWREGLRACLAGSDVDRSRCPATMHRDVRVLVTGGCGFIGSHFVKRLVAAGDERRRARQAHVLRQSARTSTASSVEFVEGDIADAEAVADAGAGCDAVVNFAAETHVDRSILGAAEFIQTDVYGTYVLLEQARATRRTARPGVDRRGLRRRAERAAPRARTTPAARRARTRRRKAGGDLQVLAYVRTYGVDACVTRGSNTYGPYQYPEKMIPLFVTNALDGEPLPVYGDGRQMRDWLHVDDHCAGDRARAARGRAGEVYNVGGGKERENLDDHRAGSSS